MLSRLPLIQTLHGIVNSGWFQIVIAAATPFRHKSHTHASSSFADLSHIALAATHRENGGKTLGMGGPLIINSICTLYSVYRHFPYDPQDCDDRHLRSDVTLQVDLEHFLSREATTWTFSANVLYFYVWKGKQKTWNDGKKKTRTTKVIKIPTDQL